jgi:hypothetical protein
MWSFFEGGIQLSCDLVWTVDITIIKDYKADR